MFKVSRRFYNWMTSTVHKPAADAWLMALSFIEAVFFVPIDLIFILFCLEKRHKVWRYALMVTVATTLGGCFSYWIGATLWQYIGLHLVTWAISEQTFNQVVAWYGHYQSLAVLIASFVPIPFKVVTLSAGFCRLPFLSFALCCFLGRLTRFTLLAGMTYIWGDQIRHFIDRFFNILVILLCLVVVTIGILAFR